MHLFSNFVMYYPLTCPLVVSVCLLVLGDVSAAYLQTEVYKYKMDLGLIILPLREPQRLRIQKVS